MSGCPTIRLLDSGRSIPALGLGTFMTTNSENVRRTILRAIEVGYRHIDTAYVYNNESDIGDALRDAVQRGLVRREDLFIVTKLPCHGNQADKVEYFLRQSLAKLKVDYVDMYLIHVPLAVKYVSDSEDLPLDEDGKCLYEETDHVLTWKEMERMVDEGLTKTIGLSNFNSKQIRNVYDAARIKPACLQVECHLYLQQPRLLEFCQGLGIVFAAYAPFGSPALGNYIKRVYKVDVPENPKILEDPILLELAQKYDKTPAQICSRFLTQRGMVVIPKSCNEKRLVENINIFDFEISSEDMEKLKSLDKNLRIYNFVLSEDTLKQANYPFGKDDEF